MRRRFLLAALALVLFALVATANSGGYRYGVSDHAFYVPAIAKSLDASLFPRDTAVLDVQKRAWLGDDILAAISRTTRLDLPLLALMGYILGLVVLVAGAMFLARGLHVSSWTMMAALALLTLRHRIPRTGANSLEGYFHPRMIAFAIGLWAFGCVVRRRPIAAVCFVALAAVAHPTTALWFGAAVAVAIAWQIDRRGLWALALPFVAGVVWLATSGVRLDAEWLSVIGGKDYLFPMAWPAYAWAANLAYPVVVWAIYQRRRTFGAVVGGETGLVVGLLVLAGIFVISVPFTAANVALVVQLQVPRVFWVLDAVVVIYLAWWVVEDFGGARNYLWRPAVVAVFAGVAVARGYYVLAIDSNRPLAFWTLPADDWTQAMDFLRHQPNTINVLADPQHALKYGTSVRVAAWRDTVLETAKDSAMAMYDRPLAVRVADRAATLDGFEDMSGDQIRAMGVRFNADVLVMDKTRRFNFPVLYENSRFVVYALR